MAPPRVKELSEIFLIRTSVARLIGPAGAGPLGFTVRITEVQAFVQAGQKRSFFFERRGHFLRLGLVVVVVRGGSELVTWCLGPRYLVVEGFVVVLG